MKRIKPNWSGSKTKNTLEFSTVLRIARMALIEKMTPRAIAKQLLIEPRLVHNIIQAKSHHGLWIDAIAELGRSGLLGQDS